MGWSASRQNFMTKLALISLNKCPVNWCSHEKLQGNLCTGMCIWQCSEFILSQYTSKLELSETFVPLTWDLSNSSSEVFGNKTNTFKYTLHLLQCEKRPHTMFYYNQMTNSAIHETFCECSSIDRLFPISSESSMTSYVSLYVMTSRDHWVNMLFGIRLSSPKVKGIFYLYEEIQYLLGQGP